MGTLVQVSVQQQVAHIRMARPELHNAFNEAMIAELKDAFEQVGGDPEVRAVVLSGEGKSFCAGADLNWMKKMIDYSFEENVADARLLSEMLRSIQDCPKPVIARIHGAAFGGGVGLIAACDMAVAVSKASFCLSEVKLGLLPAVISPFVLQKIGATHARRYFLTAERFSAEEALRLGLISAIAPDETALDAQIDQLIKALLGNGPEAVSQCKRLIEHVDAFDWDRAVQITTQMIAERRASAEGQEGMRSFLEKRPAAWTQTETTPAGTSSSKG